MQGLFITLIDVYSIVVLVSVVLSWVSIPPDHPIAQVTGTLVDPVLDPVRRMLPPVGGLDFSPMVLLVLLQVVKAALG